MCDIYNPGSRDLPEVQELDFGLLLASGALRSSTIVNDMILLSFWNALASEASGKPICYFRYREVYRTVRVALCTGVYYETIPAIMLCFFSCEVHAWMDVLCGALETILALRSRSYEISTRCIHKVHVAALLNHEVRRKLPCTCRSN